MADEDLSWLDCIGGDSSSSESTSSYTPPIWRRPKFVDDPFTNREPWKTIIEQRKLNEDIKEEEKQEILPHTAGNIIQREENKIKQIQKQMIMAKKGIYYIQIYYIIVHQILQQLKKKVMNMIKYHMLIIMNLVEMMKKMKQKVDIIQKKKVIKNINQ